MQSVDTFLYPGDMESTEQFSGTRPVVRPGHHQDLLPGHSGSWSIGCFRRRHINVWEVWEDPQMMAIRATTRLMQVIRIAVPEINPWTCVPFAELSSTSSCQGTSRWSSKPSMAMAVLRAMARARHGLPLVSPSILVEVAGMTYFLLPHCGSNWHAVCFTWSPGENFKGEWMFAVNHKSWTHFALLRLSLLRPSSFTPS